MQHLIIGAGPAGVLAAETLRHQDPGSSIAIIGDEPEPPYSRMALPYYLTGRIKEDGTYLRKSKNYFDSLKIDVIRDRVTGVDAKAGKLKLESGKDRGFDRLLIACGSSPMRPPIPGMDLDKVHSCWTLEDGRAIAAGSSKGSNVVLMGAGFIGCIVLESLAMRGVNLTVVEMGDRMVPRMMNETAGNLIKQWCEHKGVKVHTSAKVQSVARANGSLALELDGAPALKADLVIAATGVRPNTEFLKDSGIEMDAGILVDNQLRTNLENVYAAGDVCQGRDFSTGEYSVQAIQPTAADHGRIAAMNMAGREVRHQGSVNMNVLDTLGLISTSYGLWMGVDGGETAELTDKERFRYLCLQFQEDVLVGAQALGLTAHVGVLRGLIQTRVRLGKWLQRLMQDPTRVMEAYLDCTQSIGHNAALLH
jgi:NADPH-dependent 2,4-dienoyl-CoA reductase/sulfur reductase-like enzyme